MDVFLEVTRFPTGTYQFGSLFNWLGDLGQIGIDSGFEIGIGEKLNQLGATNFSMPLAQRALQQIMMFIHDLHTSMGPWESLDRRTEGQPIAD
ncbi:MAG: hypothetical protein WA628_15335 [Terriglobales bacterium]